MDYIKVKGLQKDEVVGLVKEWIKLYPHSFNPEVNLWFYELPDNQVIIGLHDDLSTLAVSLLVIYLTSALKDTTETENVVAYLTVDDNEILLKQNYGRRAKIMAKSTDDDNTGVIILLENNYCVDYYFHGKAHKIKDSELVFEEPALPESIENTEKDEIFVGDIIPKKKIEQSLEPDASPWKKLMWYAICTVVGLGIGFLLVYLYF
ncbi:MAG: hypothetical protein J6X10_07790 [Bacteroidales bacterium]|nr:hypothetical protein [Bacteroidales bacterium]